MTKRIPKKLQHSSADIARALSLFSAVRRIMRSRLAKGMRLDPSTWLQIETMKFICDNEEPKMKDIADYLSITAPSATALVGGLIKCGLVTSSAGQGDRRTSRLVLTKKGKTELKSAISRGIRHLRGLFAALSPSDLSAFSSTLERIKEKSVKAS